ncbi:MAG: hypothetical protein IT373_28245 [Polyangiaceae bacterium]|nr:hypothetical protein [Polyangiaceae bacterium]
MGSRLVWLGAAVALTAACNAILGITPGKAGAGAAGGGGTVTTSTSSGGSGGTGGVPSCVADPATFAPVFLDAWASGSVEPSFAEAMGVAVAPDGHVWLAARTTVGALEVGGSGVPTPGDGVDDGMLVELDGDTALRGVAFGGDGIVDVVDLAFLSDGTLLLVGSFTGTAHFGTHVLVAAAPADASEWSVYDAFVATFDPAASAFTAARALGDGYFQQMLGVEADADDNVYLLAGTRGALDWGDGAGPPFSGLGLAKLDAAGGVLWKRALAGDGVEFGAISLAADGARLAVTGATSSAGVFGGSDPTETVLDSTEAFVALYDASGTWQWHRLLGGVDAQAGRTVGFAPGGDVVASGTYLSELVEHGTATVFSGAETGYDGDDTWLGRFGAADGATAWLHRIWGLGHQAPASVVVDCAGRILVAGSVSDAVGGLGVDFGAGSPVLGPPGDLGTGYHDLFLAAYDGAGALVDASRLVDPYQEVAARLALDGAGRLVLAGSFWDSVSFSPVVGGTLYRTSTWDFFLARFTLSP